jgi:hypothetical protein
VRARAEHDAIGDYKQVSAAAHAAPPVAVGIRVEPGKVAVHSGLPGRDSPARAPSLDHASLPDTLASPEPRELGEAERSPAGIVAWLALIPSNSGASAA